MGTLASAHAPSCDLHTHSTHTHTQAQLVIRRRWSGGTRQQKSSWSTSWLSFTQSRAHTHAHMRTCTHAHTHTHTHTDTHTQSVMRRRWSGGTRQQKSSWQLARFCLSPLLHLLPSLLLPEWAFLLTPHAALCAANPA